MKDFGFDIPFYRLVDDAANLCRWNPTEAMRWFDFARSRAMYPVQITGYNRAVRRACATLDSIESSFYYNKEYAENFWGVDVLPTRPRLLEESNFLEDKLAAQSL